MLALGLRYKKERERRERERQVIRRQFAYAIRMLTAPELSTFGGNENPLDSTLDNTKRRSSSLEGPMEVGGSVRRQSKESKGSRRSSSEMQKSDSSQGFSQREIQDMAMALGISHVNQAKLLRRASSRRARGHQKHSKKASGENKPPPSSSASSKARRAKSMDEKDQARKGTISELADYLSDEEDNLKKTKGSSEKRPHRSASTGSKKLKSTIISQSADGTPARKARSRSRTLSFVKSAKSFFMCRSSTVPPHSVNSTLDEKQNGATTSTE